MRILVLAPHPDDEVLGVGGTIARCASEGHQVFVTIVTRGDPSIFDQSFIERGRQEAIEAHRDLGVSDTQFLEGFPAAQLDTIPKYRLNSAIGEVVNGLRPQVLFVPFGGDLHTDHRLVFEAALVAARPNNDRVIESVYAYETLSETNWSSPPLTTGFVPNTFVDIAEQLPLKVDAMRVYRSQLKAFPHERSLEAMEALARLRGATAGFMAAEAFVLVRQLRTGARGFRSW